MRLVGIDCPEQAQVPWGPQTTARLTALVLGHPVQIEVSLQSRDRYGRLLGAIWRDGQLIQEQLVREGLCVPYVVPPNVEHVDRIRAASEQARRDGLGIYAPAGPLLESPSEYRQRRWAPISRESPATPELPQPLLGSPRIGRYSARRVSTPRARRLSGPIGPLPKPPSGVATTAKV